MPKTLDTACSTNIGKQMDKPNIEVRFKEE